MTNRAREDWGRSVLKRLQGWLPEDRDAAIVDLGCGTGNLLYALRKAGYRQLSGVDISPEQVRAATALGFSVAQADILEFLQSQRGRVDVIIAFDVIEHFHKDEMFRFLDLCWQALKPLGSLILQTPNAESPWGAMHRYHDITHELGFDPAALEHVLKVANFLDFSARESGPDAHGVVSLSRWCMWRLISLCLAVWNLAETGSAGSGVYTRVFVARGRRPMAIGDGIGSSESL